MDTAPSNSPLTAATAIAREAGTLLLERFRTSLRTRAKTPTSFVTDVDEAAERLIRSRLATRFPGEPVLGEEFGFDRAPDDHEDGVWWAVDPLDGTSNYIAGVPVYCVALARFVGARPTLAVIHDPNTNEIYTAEAQRGAALNEEPLRIMDDVERGFEMVSVRHGVVRRKPDIVGTLRRPKLRSYGSVCLELAWVAGGRLDGVFGSQVHLWDVAAGGLIIEEAGGAVETSHGPLFPLRDPATAFASAEVPVIAGRPTIVERMRAALGD